MLSISEELPKLISDIKNIKERLDKLEKTESNELVYDQEEAIDFIENKLLENEYLTVDRLFVFHVLDAEEDYMRSKGIIEE